MILNERAGYVFDYACNHQILLLIRHAREQRKGNLPAGDILCHPELLCAITVDLKLVNRWVVKTCLNTLALKRFSEGIPIDPFRQEDWEDVLAADSTLA